MKVCFVYRDPGTGGNSIEEIFNGLTHELEHGTEILQFRYNKRWSLMRNIRKLLENNADVYHITGGVYFMTYFLRRHHVIMTIHDIGRYKELTGIKKWIYRGILLKGPMKLARAITTVSNFTKNDIYRVFGSSITDKVQVIYNPVPRLFVRNDKLFNQVRSRILHVGTSKNKNLISVIRALSAMDVTLIIIGQLNVEDHAALRDYHIRFENYVNLNYRDVYRQYCLADLVIFVSIHEGFGMPVLEAQATGRPVIASKMASIPEIGGDGVHYIDNPFDIDEIKAGIRKVIEDDEYRRMLIENGFRNVIRYDLSRAASAYFDLYKAV